MDPNFVLPWIVGLNAVYTLVRLVRLRVSGYRGFIAVNVLLLASLALGFLLFPSVAGYVSFGLWFLLVLVPGIGSRFIQRWTLNQRYGRARRLAMLVSFLHPFGGWPKQPQIIRALELSARGDFAAATAILENVDADHTAVGRMARMHLFRMTGQWEKLLQWFEASAQWVASTGDPALFPAYLRALGETGQSDRLISEYERTRTTTSADPGFAVVRHTSRLMVLAFFGRKQSVEHLLQGPLSSLPQTHRQFWQSTAEMAAGNVESARETLLGLQSNGDPVIRTAIERRLNHPLVIPNVVPANATLSQIERDIADEERFGELSTTRGRPAVSLALLVGNLIGFGFEVARNGTQDAEILYRLGAVQPAAVLRGEWGRVFTAQFLHFGVWHLTLNMLALVFLGRYLEFALGRLRYLAVYLVSGSAAMILVVFTHLHQGRAEVVVGASGGVMGLIGSTIAVMLVGWRKSGAQVARRRLISLAVVVVLQSAFDLASAQVSFTAHFGGIVMGLLMTLMLEHRVTPSVASR